MFKELVAVKLVLTVTVLTTPLAALPVKLISGVPETVKLDPIRFNTVAVADPVTLIAVPVPNAIDLLLVPDDVNAKQLIELLRLIVPLSRFNVPEVTRGLLIFQDPPLPLQVTEFIVLLLVSITLPAVVAVRFKVPVLFNVVEFGIIKLPETETAPWFSVPEKPVQFTEPNEPPGNVTVSDPADTFKLNVPDPEFTIDRVTPFGALPIKLNVTPPV